MSESKSRPARVQVESLLLAAQQGSLSALGRMLELHRPELCCVAERLISRRYHGLLGASDLVQETLINATRGFAAFEGSRSIELRAWLRRILVNKLTEMARRQEMRVRSQQRGPHDQAHDLRLPDGEPMPSSIVASAEAAAVIREGLARLPIKYRRVLELRIDATLGFRDIGDQLMISEDAARRLFRRALAQLKREIPPELWDH